MIRTGLVSVTFRGLPAAEVADLAARAGLAGVEWGGDVHCPHGDERVAARVGSLTRDLGLTVAAYGSYYRVGESEADPDGPAFDAVLASAVAMGAPLVRVWAGRRGSDEADQPYWARVVDDSLRVAEKAASAGVGVCYEYHRRTLTDTNASAARLLTRVDHPAVSTLWQPYVPQTVEYNLAGLRGVLPRLANVHVFAWAPDLSRLPLEDRRDEWGRYLAVLATSGREHFALLEFVADDDPERFLADAATLRALLRETPR